MDSYSQARPAAKDIAEVSQERFDWLNRNVLVGFTNKRGSAWHYRAAEQGNESNHYPEAIPVEDVERRLFGWEAIEVPLYVAVPATARDATGIDEHGKPIRYVEAQRQAIVSSDTFDMLGIFMGGYHPHQYRQWLLGQVATLLDDALSIGSAGLLKKRAVAWVEVTVPENIKTPEGVEFRPNLTAATSFDGSIATVFKRMVQLVVCDNTLRTGLSENGQEIRFRHTKNSAMRIAEAREALAIVYDTADDFAEQVKRLCNHNVTEKAWEKALITLVPDAPEGKGKRATTTVETKRFEIDTLYRNDERSQPWHGTAFGALQAYNTWHHHVQPARSGTVRAERNMRRAITGRTESLDKLVLAAVGAK